MCGNEIGGYFPSEKYLKNLDRSLLSVLGQNCSITLIGPKNDIVNFHNQGAICVFYSTFDMFIEILSKF